MKQAPKKLGRPLSFNRDDALEKAKLMFWRHGYESTSVTELTNAMGITAPSLYATFGDKKRLFFEAVNQYVSGKVTSETIIRDAPTARDAANNLMAASAVAFTGRNTPQGCLLASAAISCSAAAEDVKAKLAAIRSNIEADLVTKIKHDILIRKLPRETNAKTLASLCIAVIQGMSTLARDGAKRSELLAIVETAMRAWPE